MRWFTPNIRFSMAVAAGLALLLGISGCWTRKPVGSGHRGSDGWCCFLNAASERFNVRFGFRTWRQGLTLLMVDDLRGSAESSGDFYYYAAAAASNEHGARYECRLDTIDGRTATFRINDKEYDLSKGALFVIKAKGEKVEIHQLNRALSDLPTDGAAIGEFLNEDGEVLKIFGATHQEKQK